MCLGKPKAIGCFPLTSSVFLTSSPQCDGVPMSLPSLQGLAVLNIPSYAGGINFWGGTKEDNVSVHLHLQEIPFLWCKKLLH